MAEQQQQGRWTSSRVAHLRGAQSSRAPATSNASSAPSKCGAEHSRWAASASSSSSSASATWSTPAHGPTPASKPSSCAPTSMGTSDSRWASRSPQPPRPRPPASSDSDGMSALTASLGSASLHAAGRVRSDGLQVRDASRPVGGQRLERLALLASPSRGLDASASISTELSSQGSMDLTIHSVQDELRSYISHRLTSRVLPLIDTPSALGVLDSATYLGAAAAAGDGATSRPAEVELQQLLLQVRKLREAVVASKRIDAFAVEVYELSTHLALACADVPQLAATLPRLVLELYPTVHETPQEHRDVRQLSERLGLATGEGGRRRVVSLYLLYVLCLSGRAVRLGQYAADASHDVGALHRGLREYRSLRLQVLAMFEPIEAHVAWCDKVYAALRDTNPLALTSLLRPDDGYKVDGWQRMLVLQAVATLRTGAWAVARKAYMYLPISTSLARALQPCLDPPPGELPTAHASYLANLLMLQPDLLPPSTSTREAVVETPDDWDKPTAPLGEAEADARLGRYVSAHYGETLCTRITPLRDGYALKLK